MKTPEPVNSLWPNVIFNEVAILGNSTNHFADNREAYVHDLAIESAAHYVVGASEGILSVAAFFGAIEIAMAHQDNPIIVANLLVVGCLKGSGALLAQSAKEVSKGRLDQKLTNLATKINLSKLKFQERQGGFIDFINKLIAEPKS